MKNLTSGQSEQSAYVAPVLPAMALSRVPAGGPPSRSGGDHAPSHLIPADGRPATHAKVTDSAAISIPRARQRAPTLWVIIAIKLGKGLLFLLIALGVFSLAGEDLPGTFARFLRWVRLDPEDHVFARFADYLALVTPANMRWLASGSLLYGLLSVMEGVGLIFRLRWVGWLVICESALLIPYEIYKLNQRVSWPVAVILGLNIMIVWYLLQNRHRLFRYHHR